MSASCRRAVEWKVDSDACSVWCSGVVCGSCIAFGPETFVVLRNSGSTLSRHNSSAQTADLHGSAMLASDAINICGEGDKNGR